MKSQLTMATWTDERIEELTARWTAGESASQIAQALCVTRNAVIGKVTRLGLPKRSRETWGQASRINRDAGQTPASATRRFGANVAKPPPAPPHPHTPRPERFEAIANMDTLTAHTCRWPIGDPQAEGFGFCGRLKPIDGPYCAHHHAVAHQPASGPRTEAQAAGDEVRRHKAKIRFAQRRAA